MPPVVWKADSRRFSDGTGQSFPTLFVEKPPLKSLLAELVDSVSGKSGVAEKLKDAADGREITATFLCTSRKEFIEPLT